MRKARHEAANPSALPTCRIQCLPQFLSLRCAVSSLAPRPPESHHTSIKVFCGSLPYNLLYLTLLHFDVHSLSHS